MVRSWEKNMEFMERILLGSRQAERKSDQYIQTSDLHLQAYLRPGYMIGGQKFKDRNWS